PHAADERAGYLTGAPPPAVPLHKVIDLTAPPPAPSAEGDDGDDQLTRLRREVADVRRTLEGLAADVDVDELRAEVAALRGDVQRGLQRLERAITALSDVKGPVAALAPVVEEVGEV